MVIRILAAVLAILAGVMCLGCGRNQELGKLAVDIYLHPEGGTSDDILLQEAVRKNLGENKLTEAGVYARVLDRIVVLNGQVQTEEAKQAAERIARATQVTVNVEGAAARTVKADDVRNRLEVK